MLNRHAAAGLGLAACLLLAACSAETTAAGTGGVTFSPQASSPTTARAAPKPTHSATPHATPNPQRQARSGDLPSPAEVTAALRTARALTDEQAVGQLLMPVVEGSSANSVTPEQAADNRASAGLDTPAQIVRTYHLGGVLLTDGRPSNVENPAQISGLTAGLQQAANASAPHLPLLIATDEEQGVVNRIGPPATQFPSSMAIGATGSAEAARRSAFDTGQELRAMGLSVDLAPDADVTAGPANTVIGSRSYGSDPALVGTLSAAAVAGYQQAGVAAAAKHFPGHGDTAVDSHTATPVLHQSRAQLLADAAPFRAAVSAGVGIVMVGHLDAEAIDPGLPASLSARVVNGVLRGAFGYRGVVMTDAMNMEPITSRYDSGQAAVHAIQAGVDVVLQPVNIYAAYQGLLAALHDGALGRGRVNESVARILALKRLISAHPAPPPNVVGSPAHQGDSARIADAAVTVLSGRCSGRQVPAAVRLVGDASAVTTLTAALRARGVAVTPGAPFTIAVLGYGDTTPPPANVTVAADTPYVLASAHSPTRIAAYASDSASMNAVADVLVGRLAARGRSPVAVAGLPRTACG